VATGLAAAIKLTPLIFVAYLLITRRTRGALNALVTFIACEAIAFVVNPGASWTYWTKYVFDSRRAGALLYSSDQNLSSALQRMHHGPVSSFVLLPLLVAICVGGLALAAWAHRRSSTVLGLLVCAVTGLIISPITWVHHMVWVAPVIIWLAAGADRPRRGPLLAGASAVLFMAAPIWWVPRSWKVTNNPPELHQNGWQFLVGNSFFLAMLIFVGGVAAMLGWRSGAFPRGPTPPESRILELRERVLMAGPHACAEGRLDAAYCHPSVIAGGTDPDLVDDYELVGFTVSAHHCPADRAERVDAVRG
jgi:alpha-1,2-mannosyltransferase